MWNSVIYINDIGVSGLHASSARVNCATGVHYNAARACATSRDSVRSLSILFVPSYWCWFLDTTLFWGKTSNKVFSYNFYNFTSKYLLNKGINIRKISFTLYPANSRVGSGNPVLGRSVANFPLNPVGIACWVAKLIAALSRLDTASKKMEILNI